MPSAISRASINSNEPMDMVDVSVFKRADKEVVAASSQAGVCDTFKASSLALGVDRAIKIK
jgi:hypothetical protein